MVVSACTISNGMKLYENIEVERDRIEACIKKFGWTSDHNLDWFSVAVISEEGKPAFAEFEDGSGILFHIYSDGWQIWSDPLGDKKMGAERVEEFINFAFKEGIDRVWCNYISDNIYPALSLKKKFKINSIDYSLDWPVLNMEKFDLSLPGGHFKDIRNARSKFNREHKIHVLDY